MSSHKQLSLHSFFPTIKKDGRVFEVKRFFYLKWVNKYSPMVHAEWLMERPRDVNFIEEVKWNQLRKTHTFYLCGHFPDIHEKKFFIPSETKYKNVQYLKSHLQKCIRKQNDDLAIRTAVHYMKLDMIDFLRRLPIIMIEDVMLHESFTTLMWLMISQSSTTFKIKRYMCEWLLGLIYVLCKMERKDVIEYEELDENIKLIDLVESYHGLNQEQCSILYSMQLRTAYGGMRCDMDMFSQYANRWKKRFEGNGDGLEIERRMIRNISFHSVQILEIEMWDVSAIDFHCNGKIIEYVMKRYPDYTEDEIKQLIWKNLSSINHRQQHEIYDVERWNQIKGHIERTQKYLLESSNV